MANPDYESLTDAELLQAAQSAGVAAPQATPTSSVHASPKTGATPQESSGMSTAEGIGLGAAGLGAGILAAKFPALRTAISNLAARSRMGAPMRQTAEAVLRDVGDTQAASTRLRDLAGKMRSLNSPETVGDVLGPQGQALAKASAAGTGPEAAAYANQLEQRQQGTAQRTSDVVKQALGGDTPYTQQEQQFIDLQRARAQPLYDAAYQQFPSVPSKVLMDVLSDPAGVAASKNAVTELARRGQSVGPVTPGGMVQNPSLAYLDQVKRELDKQVGAYRRAAVIGTDPTAKAKAASLGGVRDRLVSEVDHNTTLPNGVSPYATARAQFSSDQKVIDALRAGHDDFDGMEPAELQAQIGKYPPGSAERDAFHSGVQENLLRKIGRTPSGGDAARKLINSSDAQAKIQALFDNPNEAEQFVRAIERESGMLQFSKDALAARSGAPLPGASPGMGIPAHTALGAVAGSPWHQRAAALRIASKLLPQRKFPDPGVSTIMSQTGGQGANTLEDLADAMGRFSNP